MENLGGFGAKAQAFCELVGIETPIVQAPMAGGWTTPALVAAVANAGGLGMVAGGLLSAAKLSTVIAETRQLTGRPFGVNFLLAPPEPFDGHAGSLQTGLNLLREELGLPAPGDELAPPPPTSLDEQLEIVLAARVPLVSFAMGNPAAYVERIHAGGALVCAMATTVTDARMLAEAGVDVIVAQGAEAGGHRSTFQPHGPSDLPLVGTVVLVPCVVDAVARPVLAAGGLMDGRGLAAALALGASGVQMGTRFLTTRESGAYPDYRRRLLAARETDSRITWHLSGRPARSLGNRLLDHLEASGPPLPWPFQAMAIGDIYGAAAASNRSDYAVLLAGQGTLLAHEAISAGAVVAAITAQARRVLAEIGPARAALGPSDTASAPPSAAQD